ARGARAPAGARPVGQVPHGAARGGRPASPAGELRRARGAGHARARRPRRAGRAHGAQARRPPGGGERRDVGRGLPLGTPAGGDDGRARRPPEVCAIVYTGRLLRGKGLEDLLEAFARMAAEVPPARLVIVGSGAGQALSVEETLRAAVAAAGLGARVSFTGRLDDVEVALRA